MAFFVAIEMEGPYLLCKPIFSVFNRTFRRQVKPCLGFPCRPDAEERRCGRGVAAAASASPVPPIRLFSTDLSSSYPNCLHLTRNSREASTIRRGILYREMKALEMIRIVISHAFRIDSR
jgi:hypothetical protein